MIGDMGETEDFRAFLWTYYRLSLDGFCDSPFGKEFERVLQEWIADDMPFPTEPFIRARANVSPSQESVN